MQRKPFDAELREDGRRRVLVLKGELDVQTAPDLRAALGRADDEGDGEVVVDVGEVTFMDSTGLGVLVGACNRLRAQDRAVILRRPTANVRRLLSVTGVSTVLTVEG